jgi:hypothetical protein
VPSPGGRVRGYERDYVSFQAAAKDGKVESATEI